jgi:hypothetical protein
MLSAESQTGRIAKRVCPSQRAGHVPNLWLDTGLKVGTIALSHGERVGRDGAFTSRRGPGEGLLPSPSKFLCPARPSPSPYTHPVHIPLPRTRKLRRNPTEAENRHRLCCPVERCMGNSAVPAGSRAGLSISTASNIDRRSSLMTVCILSRAQCAKTLRKRIVMLAGLISPCRATDPSPVPLRLVKAPERDTLSPGERAADSVLPPVSSQRCGTSSAPGVGKTRSRCRWDVRAIVECDEAPTITYCLLASDF